MPACFQREDPVGATGGSDALTAQQRQQLMKIMMEKQEQVREQRWKWSGLWEHMLVCG